MASIGNSNQYKRPTRNYFHCVHTCKPLLEDNSCLFRAICTKRFLHWHLFILQTFYPKKLISRSNLSRLKCFYPEQFTIDVTQGHRCISKIRCLSVKCGSSTHTFSYVCIDVLLNYFSPLLQHLKHVLYV